MKQSKNHKVEPGWRICAIFFPQLSLDSTTTVTSTLDLIKPLAKEIFIITGNFPQGVISGDNIHLINIRHNDRPLPMLMRISRFIMLQLKISYHLVRTAGKIDLVFLAAGASIMLLPALLAKLMGKKIVLLRHGTSSFQKTNKTDYQGTLFGIGMYIFPPVIDFIIGLNCTLADRLAVFSSDLTDSRLRRYTGKISHGSRFYVDTDFFRITKDVSSRKEIIGYIGRFEEIKGVVNFIKAVSLVFKEPVGVEVVIGGDGPQRDDINKEIADAKSGDRVTLTGWIPHDKLPQYLNEIKLLVIPSYAEVGPHIVFEAMACGTPVLATPVGIIPDIVKDGETGFIMEDNSPQCIARNIIRALNYPDLDRIAKTARVLVEKEYTHEAAVDRYRKILSDLK